MLRLYRNIYLHRILAITLVVTSLLVSRGFTQAQFDEAGEQQLVQLINQDRTSRGLPALAVDEHLTQAARKHTELMAEHKSLSHQFDGESSLPVRFGDENLRSDQQAENIGLGRNVFSAHRWFMLSPEHRANVVSPKYNAVGVAVLKSGDHVYVTEDFAHRLKTYSDSEAEAVVQRAVENYASSHGMPVPMRKPQTELRNMACDMALNDSVRSKKVSALSGVEESAAWTSADPSELPSSAKELLSHPISSGYSLAACFAPSVSQPGGIYWVAMVVY